MAVVIFVWRLVGIIRLEVRRESKGASMCIMAKLVVVVTCEWYILENDQLSDGNSFRDPNLNVVQDLLS